MNIHAPAVVPPLIDPFGRAITYVRVSVTDRCDYRCVYCMSEDMNFLPKRDVLSLEELDRLCSTFVSLGARKIRITGGEPLVRRNVMSLFHGLSRHLSAGTLDEVTVTTNGSQLARFASELADCGVRRVNVSLDTLDPDKFRQVTRWGDLSVVLGGRHRRGFRRRAQSQDQHSRPEGFQRGRSPGSGQMGKWARLRPDLHRGDAARGHGARPSGSIPAVDGIARAAPRVADPDLVDLRHRRPGALLRHSGNRGTARVHHPAYAQFPRAAIGCASPAPARSICAWVRRMRSILGELASSLHFQWAAHGCDTRGHKA